jgi:hypothetical protein
MNIYKLRYLDKESAISDLIAKGCYLQDEDFTLPYGEGVQAIVEIGLIALEDATYDEQGNELTPTVYDEGYHYDVMSSEEIVFENEIIVNNPKHTFAGYN